MRFEDLINRFDLVKKNLERRSTHVPDFSAMQQLITKYQTLRQERETFAKMRRQLDAKTGFRKQAGRMTGKNQEGYQKAIAMLSQFDKQITLVERLIRTLAASWPKCPDATVPDGNTWHILSEGKSSNRKIEHDIVEEAERIDTLRSSFLKNGFSLPSTQLTKTLNQASLSQMLLKSFPVKHHNTKYFEQTADNVVKRLDALDYDYQWRVCPVERLPVYAHKRYVFAITHPSTQDILMYVCLDDGGYTTTKEDQAIVMLSFTKFL